MDRRVFEVKTLNKSWAMDPGDADDSAALTKESVVYCAECYVPTLGYACQACRFVLHVSICTSYKGACRRCVEEVTWGP